MRACLRALAASGSYLTSTGWLTIASMNSSPVNSKTNASSHPHNDAHAPPTVTLIANNEQLSDVLTASLTPSYQLNSAQRATDGLALLENSNSKIVFVDLILDDIDGLSLIEEIRTRYRCLHIVAIMCKNELASVDLTAESITLMAAQSGANGVFIAPFNLAELLTTVERFCEAAIESETIA